MPQREITLTAIIPAPNGCNLKCAGCIIDQKGEGRPVLKEDDYRKFFHEVIPLKEVIAFSTQGHEPLLPDIRDLTFELLGLAIKTGKSATCVTNGVELANCYNQVMAVTNALFVSLDSGNPVVHDKLRGVDGAWERTVTGLRKVRSEFGEGEKGDKYMGEYLYVASVLYPNKTEHLKSVPALLSSLGIKNWVITPYISIDKEGFDDKNNGRIVKNVIHLGELANKFGVNVVLSDEFRQLDETADLFETFSLGALDEQDIVHRLSPDGRYCVGREIMTPSKPRIWEASIDPVTFIREAHDRYVSKLN